MFAGVYAPMPEPFDEEPGEGRDEARGDEPRRPRKPRRPVPAPKVETDPRFPSGEWKGFWLQRGVAGRQWMSLTMQFLDCRISGEGRDRVGQFRLSGRY